MTHDLEMNFNKIAPFGKEDTAKELQDHAAKTLLSMQWRMQRSPKSKGLSSVPSLVFAQPPSRSSIQLLVLRLKPLMPTMTRTTIVLRIYLPTCTKTRLQS